MKKLIITASLALLVLILASCTGKQADDTTPTVQPSQTDTAMGDTDTPDSTPTKEVTTPTHRPYLNISQEEAKAIMDSGVAHIILDVRTEAEFASGHIAGAILIPNTEIEEKAGAMLPDKNALILVYCRSGNRSKQASQVLLDMGYTNIREFGGIIDWQYGIVN